MDTGISTMNHYILDEQTGLMRLMTEEEYAQYQANLEAFIASPESEQQDGN